MSFCNSHPVPAKSSELFSWHLLSVFVRPNLSINLKMNDYSVLCGRALFLTDSLGQVRNNNKTQQKWDYVVLQLIHLICEYYTEMLI